MYTPAAQTEKYITYIHIRNILPNMCMHTAPRLE